MEVNVIADMVIADRADSLCPTHLHTHSALHQAVNSRYVWRHVDGREGEVHVSSLDLFSVDERDASPRGKVRTKDSRMFSVFILAIV